MEPIKFTWGGRTFQYDHQKNLEVTAYEEGLRWYMPSKDLMEAFTLGWHMARRGEKFLTREPMTLKQRAKKHGYNKYKSIK